VNPSFIPSGTQVPRTFCEPSSLPSVHWQAHDMSQVRGTWRHLSLLDNLHNLFIFYKKHIDFFKYSIIIIEDLIVKTKDYRWAAAFSGSPTRA
jgi:hypothetical protein